MKVAAAKFLINLNQIDLFPGEGELGKLWRLLWKL